MPRFENKGFNPEKRNQNEQHDRTVPEDENYYGFSPIDLNFNSRERVRGTNINKDDSGINPCSNDNNEYIPDLEPPQRFRSEQAEDFLPPPQKSRQPKPDRTPEAVREKPKWHKSDKDKKPSGRRKKITLIKAIPIAILVIILIAVGCVSSVFGKVNYNDKQENTYVSDTTLEDSSLVKNILLLGVDARAGENAEETRSDTMMLISLDMKHKCIKMTSFLRDTWVYVPTLGYEQRLNAACSSGGYQGVVDAIEYNFGVDIDGYAVVDFEMFKVLVDSLGGVEVDVTKEEAKEVTSHPKRYGKVKLEAGKNKLTGEQALAYCRIRKIDTDFVRTQRQRTVMTAILHSAKRSGPIRLYNMAAKSAPYIETDLSKGELKRLVAQAGICLTGEMQQAKVPFEKTWDYATIYGNSVISINTEKNKQMLIDFIYGDNSEEATE